MKYNITIPGEPQGKGRHRMTKKGHTYTPKKTKVYEDTVKIIFKSKYKKQLEGELIAEITAYLKIPKSATKGKKLAMKHNEVRPTKKPDGDNIAKIILDSLNKLAYHDDSQVVDLVVRKWWTLDNPRVEVVIREEE